MDELRERATVGYDAERPSRQPANTALVDEAPWGDRVADKVVAFIGSWRFLLIQTVVVALWIAGNVMLIVHFDPYPFILLNLAFSTQAAYAGPLILLAGNRAAARDRMTLEHAAAEADVEEEQNERLLEGNRRILLRLEELERQILDEEQHIGDLPDGGTPDRVTQC